MSRFHLRRPTPGLIVAVVALFVALGGGAWAATSDTKSDKKIAKKAASSYFNSHIGGASVSHASTANSANSATNATNATNATTANTAKEATGLSGPLASGKTETGTFGVAGNNSPTGFVQEDQISYQLPLASAATFNEIAPGGAATAACPGSSDNPQAAPGNLCVYDVARNGSTGLTQRSFSANARRFGVVVFAAGVAANANYQIDGTWAVTAP